MNGPNLAFEEETLMEKTRDYLRDEYGVFESGNLSKSRCIHPLSPKPILCKKIFFVSCFPPSFPLWSKLENSKLSRIQY